MMSEFGETGPKSKSRSRSKATSRPGLGCPIQNFGTGKQSEKDGRWHPRVGHQSQCTQYLHGTQFMPLSAAFITSARILQDTLMICILYT